MGRAVRKEEMKAAAEAEGEADAEVWEEADVAAEADDEWLNEQLLATMRANPHCAQLGATIARPFLQDALRPRKFRDRLRFVAEGWPRMPYVRRADGERSSCHWGQLKLFESELKCLTDGGYVARSPEAADAAVSPLVIYVGAAPGRHLPALARRLPRCRFELYDPAEFDPALLEFAASDEASGRVSIVRGFFDEARLKSVAERQEGSSVILFSDIRTADPSQMDYEEVERVIERDMARQRAWVEALRPSVSMLKFRLPWGPGTSRYLHGRVLVQAFAPCTSTETRLIVTREAIDFGDKDYDQEEYEQRLMHHNTVGRARLHRLGDVPTVGPDVVPGLDQCYDCAALVATVRRYLAARNGIRSKLVSGAQVVSEVSAIISELGGDSGRNLATPYHVSYLRHDGRRFAKRKYVDPTGRDRFSEEHTWPEQRKRARRHPENAACEQT
mmetsp:Transcript_96901/g.273906  ORF Transcript_96901/g.273906 Transcript_96901/m.273906 type:complete len:445 (-) Transcript_96901:46-1380(-)